MHRRSVKPAMTSDQSAGLMQLEARATTCSANATPGIELEFDRNPNTKSWY